MTDVKTPAPEQKKKPERKAVEKKPNIYQKILTVQSKVQTVIKGGKNTHHGYTYAREIDVIAEVKPVLIEVGLTIFPNTKSFTKSEKLSRVEVEFWLINVDNPEEMIVSTFHGEGEDKAGSVVGTPIAYTMALKYFLAKTFLIETGDDAEVNVNGKKPKGNGTVEDVKVIFEKAKKMIAGTNNIGGLIEYEAKMNEGKTFNAAQKAELKALIAKRVSDIEGKQ